MQLWLKNDLCKNVLRAGFCTDGKHAVLVDEAGSPFYVELEKGAQAPAAGCGFNAVGEYEKFRWQGAEYLINPKGHGLELYNLTANYVVGVLTGHKDFVTCAQARPDYSRLVSGSFDKTFRIWDLVTRKQLASFSLPAEVKCAVFSADAQFVLAVCNDDRVSLWKP